LPEPKLTRFPTDGSDSNSNGDNWNDGGTAAFNDGFGATDLDNGGDGMTAQADTFGGGKDGACRNCGQGKTLPQWQQPD
jgi:hypothetical protein